jgi:outer membrane lipoprotein SlyB
MLRGFGFAACLAVAMAMPAHEAAAQDALGGAIIGGVGGAIVGGAIGGSRGAAVGAIVGAGTGAAIASEGERRRGYYYYREGCYLQRPDGAYVRVDPRYCY